MATIGLFSSLNDKRIVITPSTVTKLTKNKHRVLFHKNFSLHSGFSNYDYENGDATPVKDLSDLIAKSNILIMPSMMTESQAQIVNPGTIIFSFSYLYTNPQLALILSEKNCTVIAMEEYVISDIPVFFPALRQLTSMIAFSMLYKLLIEEGELLIESDTVAFIGFNPVTTSIAEQLKSVGVNSVFFSDNQGLSIKIRPIDEISAFLPSIKALILLPSDKFTNAEKVISIDQISMMQNGSVILDLASFYGGCIDGVFPQIFTQTISSNLVLSNPLIYSDLASLWIKSTNTISEDIILNYLEDSASVADNCLHINNGVIRADIMSASSEQKIDIDIEEINFEIANILSN